MCEIQLTIVPALARTLMYAPPPSKMTGTATLKMSLTEWEQHSQWTVSATFH
jgi:hypothetical protein